MIDAEKAWRGDYAHPGAWDRDFAPLTLTAMFDDSVARTPDAPLTDFMGKRMSYREIGAAADRFARGLIAGGFAVGDRVGLFLPNVPDYLIAYYGVLKAGGIVVNMSPLYSRAELAHQIADSGARIVVTVDVPALFDTARALVEDGVIDRVVVASLSVRLPAVKALLMRLLKRRNIAAIPDDVRIVRLATFGAQGGTARLPVVDAHDVALIQYTGGTTGVPKGAILTHQNLSANARQIHALDPEQGEDRIIGVLPFFHVFANTAVLNRTVLAGGMIAMLPRFDAKATLATIGRVKATALPGVPTMYQALLDHPSVERTDFASLRICISGGAPLAAALKRKFETATGARVIEGYGLTESAGVVACNPYAGAARDGTIGHPIPGTRIRLVDREDPTRAPPSGEPGELVVEGPQIMRGYWNRPDADADTFVDGALRTGDVATIDAEGYVRIVDRLKDMISVGGFKVFPSQVEAVLYTHEAVKEAIVIGVDHDYLGEMPKAFVTLVEDMEVTGQALVAWLNPKLGKHERVLAVEVRETLPKTLVGKLSRKELIAEERALTR